MRVDSIANIGAYMCGGAGSLQTFQYPHLQGGVYRIPRVELRVRTVLTNTTPIGVTRGPGFAEAINIIERLIDLAARGRVGQDGRAGGDVAGDPGGALGDRGRREQESQRRGEAENRRGGDERPAEEGFQSLRQIGKHAERTASCTEGASLLFCAL